MAEPKNQDITLSDISYVTSILSKYNTYVDILGIIIIFMIVGLTFFVLRPKARNQWMLLISCLLIICILIFTIRRVYFTIKTDMHCHANETQPGLAIDSTNRLRIITSFVYYYVLTFLGTLIWSSICFIIVYMLYICIYANYNMPFLFDISTSERGFWKWYKIISYLLAKWFVLPSLFIFIIPLTFYTKQKDPNFFLKILNGLKTGFEHKIFQGIFGWLTFVIIPGALIRIELLGHSLLSSDWLRILAHDMSHSEVFTILDLKQHAQLHGSVFLNGIVFAIMYSVMMLEPVTEPCGAAWVILGSKILAGYFIAMALVIVLYGIEAGKLAFKIIIST